MPCALEQRQLALATNTAPAPYLHPNRAEIHRERVADWAALSFDRAAEERKMIRGLIDTITLHPDAGALRVEILGELSAILGMSQARDADSASDLAVQIKLVAGTGFGRQLTLLAVIC